jgi:hypothetical protein
MYNVKKINLIGFSLTMIISLFILPLPGHTQTGGISGVVVDGNGMGISDVWVYATETITQTISKSNTGADGVYLISALPEGIYKVFFQTSGEVNYLDEWFNKKYSLSASDNVFVSAGYVADYVDAILSEGGIINGTVKDMYGNGVGNIWVFVYSATDQTNTIKYSLSKDDGSFMVGGIPAGTYKVQFDPLWLNYYDKWYDDQGGFPTAQSITVASGSSISSINATLDTKNWLIFLPVVLR